MKTQPLVCLVLLLAQTLSACGTPTGPEAVSRNAGGETRRSETCVSADLCPLEGLTVAVKPTFKDHYCELYGCEVPEGAGTGGGSAGTGLPTSEQEGPGVFIACVGAIIGTVPATVGVKAALEELYWAREAVLSAERMLQTEPLSLPVRLQLQYQLEQARLRYDNAVNLVAGMGLGSAVLIGVATMACLPTNLLPTP